MWEPQDELESEEKGKEVEDWSLNTREPSADGEGVNNPGGSGQVVADPVPSTTSETGSEPEAQLQRESQAGEEEEEDRQHPVKTSEQGGPDTTTAGKEEEAADLDTSVQVVMLPREDSTDGDDVTMEIRPRDFLLTTLAVNQSTLFKEQNNSLPECEASCPMRVETEGESGSNEPVDHDENARMARSEGDGDVHGAQAILEGDDLREVGTEVRIKEGEAESQSNPEDTNAGPREGGDGSEVPENETSEDHPPLRRSDSSIDFEAMCLTSNFVDSEHLFELLCRCQSRRLNDQRCSFRKKRRATDGARPWKSAPASPATERRVFFASVTSLQAERFFDMLACSQGRRLNDQRADFQEASASHCQEDSVMKQEPEPQSKPEMEPEAKARTITAPTRELCRVPDDELYNTIITYQAGRIEEQRSDPPLSAAAEDFFDLILRVQGGRMEEQRVELPRSLMSTAQRVNSR